VVVAISALTLLGAVVRRIAGRGHREIGAGRTDPGTQESVAQLAAEVESLRDEVTVLRRGLDESQNRLDFTERVLAQVRERGLLAPPKER
jgi:hypothetical protein